MSALRPRFHHRLPVRAGVLSSILFTVLSVALFLNQGHATQACSPEDPPRHDLWTIDGDHRLEEPDPIRDGVVTHEIANRPAGDHVVSITPLSGDIIISGSDLEPSLFPAPLRPDHPEKDDPAFDPGAQRVRDALAGGRNVVVLSRPAGAMDDADARLNEWDAWRTTYLELVASGRPFVECEIRLDPQVEQCWITDPAPSTAERPEPVFELADPHRPTEPEE